MSVSQESRARLIELIKQLAVIHGPVTLSSGIQANYYVDLRRATLHHEAAPLIGKAMLDLLDDSGIKDFDSVGGLTMGADPVATAMLHQAASLGRSIDAFVVRKVAKDHGMGRQVEGPDVSGKKVIVLEDTSTTGGSPLTAARALEKAGATVVAVATVVDRATGAAEAIQDAGYRYIYAVSLKDLGL
jgi:orotate phosphoribosyltransferase